MPCSASESGAVHRSIDDLLPHQVGCGGVRVWGVWVWGVRVCGVGVGVRVCGWLQVRPREVVAEDLFRALERGGATVGPEMLERYHTFTGRFGQTG